MKKQAEEISFKDLLSIFVAKMWLIVIVAVLAGATMGIGTALLVDDTYTATATLYSYVDRGNANINDITVAQQQVKTYEQVFKSKNFLNFVVAELSIEDREIIAPLIPSINIRLQQRDSTEAFDISITTNDPYVSYKVADAVARVSEAKIPELIPNAGEVTIWDYPEMPTSSNSKNITRNAVIGFLGGAILTMIAVFIYNIFDVVVHDRKKLEDSFNIPILSVIPRHDIFDEISHRKIQAQNPVHDTVESDKKRMINSATPFAISEAFKTFYTNILYIPTDSSCKKIAITSAISGEGKTYISTNLALAIADSSSECKVLLIDADMRKPRVTDLFDVLDKKSHGLSEYLAGIDENPCIQKTNKSNLFVLSSGAESANATALIGSSRFPSMMRELECEYKFIIFDTPPVNIVSDAILLNEYIDGYVVSVKTDYSDINSIDELVNKITHVDGKVLGFSLTSFPLKGYNKKGVGKNGKYAKYSKYSSYTSY